MALRQPPAGRNLQGILVPEFGLFDATVTATNAAGGTVESGPRPGEAVPAQRTPMQMVPSGVLDAALDAIDVVTLRAGAVGTATQRWKYSGDDLRSWDPPTVASGFAWIDRSVVTNRYTRPHVIRRASTGELVTSVSYALNTVKVWRQSPTAAAPGGWSVVTVEDTGADTVSCLVEDATSGRLFCLYTYEVGTADTQIRLAFSDDGGATWAVGSNACLPETLAVSSDKILRIRAEILNGIMVLVVWEQDTDDVLYQYVSEVVGGPFNLVETISADTHGCPDTKVRDGVLYLVTVASDTLQPYLRRITSAGQAFSSAELVLALDGPDIGTGWEWGVLAGGLLTESECALLIDDDGVLYLYGNDHNTGGGATYETGVTLSRDGGDTWTWMSVSGLGTPVGAVPHYSGDAGSYLKDIAVAPERGRAVLVSRHVAVSGGADDSLSTLMLGGWTTVGKAEDASQARDSGVAGWSALWLPIDKPDDTGFAAETLTGASTSTLTSAGHVFTVAGVDTLYQIRTLDISTAPESGAEVELQPLVGSGSAIHQLTISNGAASYSVRVTLTTTTATLRDMTAGADIGSPLAIAGSSGVALRIAVDKPTASGAWGTNVGRVRAWVRVDGPYTGGVVNYGPRADREWVQIASSTTLVAGVTGTSTLTWGLVAAGVVTYRMVAEVGGFYTGGNIVGSSVGVTRGRLLTGVATPYHLVGGLRMHGEKGPTMAGDTWTHTTAYEYPVSAIQPNLNPSLRKVHRTDTDAAELNFKWVNFSMGWRSGDILGIYVRGNWRTATLYRDLGGATTVATIDKGLPGLAFTRQRGTLIPANGGLSAKFPFHENLLAGAYVDFGGGIVRKVRTNRAGGWLAGKTPGSYASAQIELEGWEAGDPSSGTFTLIMPGGLFLTEEMAATAVLRLKIPAQDTAENYFETSTALIGRFRVFGHEHGFGRGLTVTPAYDLAEARGGGRRGRRRAPARRALEFAFDEGVDTTGIHTFGAAANHLTWGYTGATALAAPADLPRTLMGIFEAMDGAVLPGVFCPAVPQISAATTGTTPIIDLNPEAALYGNFLTETLRMDNVLGNEMQDPGEMFRIPTLRWELIT